MEENIVPSWLDLEFITSVLQEKDKNFGETKVINFEIRSRVGAGNNHFSSIHRIKVEFNIVKKGKKKTEVKYLLIKERNSDKFIRNVVEGGKFVEKEYLMYKEILPLMMKTMKHFNICPKYYPSKFPNIFVLDDLNECGYVMCDRLKQLDFEHSAMFMKSIASFHAVSVAVHKQNPIIIMSVGEEYLQTMEENHSSDFVSCWFTKFYKVVETWQGYERFGRMIRNQLNTFPERLAEVFTPRKNFNVLNHGDTWTNNILFKYNETGNIIDVKLIDYQVCRYASLGLDLQYFTWTSIQDEVRTQRIDELYSIYLQTLNSQLRSLGCEERLTEEQLQNEIDFTGVFVIYVIIFVLPFTLNDPENIIKLEECDYLLNTKNDDKDPLINIYQSKYFESTVKAILCQLESKGIIK